MKTPFAKLFDYPNYQLLAAVHLQPIVCFCGQCGGVELAAILSCTVRVGEGQLTLLLNEQRGGASEVDKLLAEFNQLDADEALRIIMGGYRQTLSSEVYEERSKMLCESLRLRAGVPLAA